MKKLTWLLVVSLLPCSLLAGEKDDEIELFVGHWKITQMVQDGHVTAEAELKGVQFEFTETYLIFRMAANGEGFEMIANEDGDKTQFDIDVKSSPNPINLHSSDEEDSSFVRGIYKMNGESITICFSNDVDGKRPTKFESTTGSDTVMLELKLIK